MSHHINANEIYNQVSWEALSEAYKNFYGSWSDITKEHCNKYEKLTLEQKMLVDEDLKYLEERCEELNLSVNRIVIEECIVELYNRDKNERKNNNKRRDK